jgi:putative membrane protein
MRLLVRIILNAIAILIAAYLVPGIVVTGALAALVAGLILGFVNAIVRPILILLTLPVTLLTLGLFLFVVNAVCLGLTAALVPGFDISSASSAFLGALIVTFVSWVLNALVMTDSQKGGVTTW